MRWRTANKRARCPRGLTKAPYRWDYFRRRLSWEAMRQRLSPGALYLPTPDQLRDDLRAPQFRRFVSNPAIQIVPKLAPVIRGYRPTFIAVDEMVFVGVDHGR